MSLTESDVLNPRQIFVSTDPVPSRPVAVLSVLAHLVALAGIVVLLEMPRVRVIDEKYATKISGTKISRTPRLSFSASTAKGSSSRGLSIPRAHRTPRMEFVPMGATEGSASKTVLERARKASAAIVADLQQPIAIGGYELPAWVSGDLPSISAAEFPSQIEQFLVVEITIDADGSVVQAKLVTGAVTPSVEHRLFSAILGFKYKPASRGGTPIPSQLDLVVHVPS